MGETEFQCEHMHLMNTTARIKEDILDGCNVFFRRRYLPNTVINAVFLLLGIVGNILVIYVYRRKVRTRREDHYFIVVLAIIDLLHCIFSSNLVFAKNTNPLKYPDDISCKLLLYFTNVFFILSLLVLVVICIHRYRKICHPLRKQMSKRVKEWSLIGVVVISSVLALPKAIYFKVQTIEVEDLMFANVCGPDMSMLGAKELIKSSTIFLIVMSSVLIIVMGILYSCVGGVIYRQTRHFKEMKDQSARLKLLFSNLPESSDKKDLDTAESQKDPNNVNADEPVHPPLKMMISGNPSSAMSSSSSVEICKSATLNSKKSNKTDASTLSQRKRSLAHSLSASAKAHKSSIMFIVITIVTILSFIPTWIFVLFDSVNPGRWFRVSNLELQLFLFMRCLHAIGYTANPVIYAYYDRSFRRELKAMICRRKSLNRGLSSSS